MGKLRHREIKLIPREDQALGDTVYLFIPAAGIMVPGPFVAPITWVVPEGTAIAAGFHSHPHSLFSHVFQIPVDNCFVSPHCHLPPQIPFTLSPLPTSLPTSSISNPEFYPSFL